MRRQIVHAHLGSNQYEAQFFAKLREQRAQLSVDIEIDLGLERGAERTGHARLFQFTRHLLTHRHTLSQYTSLVNSSAGSSAACFRFRNTFRALPRHVSPDFVGSEAQNRRHPACQRFEQVIHGGLGGSPRTAVSARRVHSVLEHIQIEAAQIDGTELVQALVDDVEAVAVVSRDNL
jgi:hypothetical protein